MAGDEIVIRTTSLVLCIMLSVMLFMPAASADRPSVNTMEQMEKHIDSLLNDMTLDEKIYQLFIVTLEVVAGVDKATKATKATQIGLAATPVGGMIYFSVNIQNKVQITEMIANSQTFAKDRHGIGLFIAVDEEGGSVVRVAGKLKTNKLDSMRTIGRHGDLNEAYSVGKTIAQYISPLGFNLNFAPVADVNIDGKNTEIGSRSFGDDPVLVADMAVQVMKGLTENGVMATLKHFPGHGSTFGNSHYGKSISSRTLSQMEQAELLPFIKGIAAGAECIMISHLTAVEIDSEYPASLSKTVVTGLLRERLGYDGLGCSENESNLGKILICRSIRFGTGSRC